MEEIELSPLSRMQIGATQFNHPTLTFVHEYWTRKRGERRMPSRGDIVASELKQHLGWVLLADVLPGMADFRYRLIGSLIAAYFEADGTNRTIRETFSPYGEPAVKGTLYIYRKAASRCLPVRVMGQADWLHDGVEPFESVYLPLSNDDENVNMILSAFVFDKDAVLINRAIAREHLPPAACK